VNTESLDAEFSREFQQLALPGTGELPAGVGVLTVDSQLRLVKATAYSVLCLYDSNVISRL